jgi:hypothetical protein
LLSAGVDAGTLLNAGATPSSLLQSGVSAEQLSNLGLTGQQISEAGASSQQLGSIGSTLEQQAAAKGAGEAIPFQLPDGTMGSIKGGDILDAAGNVVAKGGGTSLSDIAGYAGTGAKLIGGLGQLAGGAAKVAGGVGAVKAGQQAGTLSKQADPFAQYRPQLGGQLYNLLSNPSTITSTPGYQFNLSQGLQAMQSQQAAQGRLVSGGGLLQAQQFGQQYAQSSLQQQESLLAQLSGATQSPGSGATAAGNLIGGQLGGTLGGVQAIGGGLGTLGSGLSNTINPLQTLYANYNQPSPSVGP